MWVNGWITSMSCCSSYLFILQPDLKVFGSVEELRTLHAVLHLACTGFFVLIRDSHTAQWIQWIFVHLVEKNVSLSRYPFWTLSLRSNVPHQSRSPDPKAISTSQACCGSCNTSDRKGPSQPHDPGRSSTHPPILPPRYPPRFQGSSRVVAPLLTPGRVEYHG